MSNIKKKYLLYNPETHQYFSLICGAIIWFDELDDADAYNSKREALDMINLLYKNKNAKMENVLFEIKEIYVSKEVANE